MREQRKENDCRSTNNITLDRGGSGAQPPGKKIRVPARNSPRNSAGPAGPAGAAPRTTAAFSPNIFCITGVCVCVCVCVSVFPLANPQSDKVHFLFEIGQFELARRIEIARIPTRKV
jgi:hypothetical protein